MIFPLPQPPSTYMEFPPTVITRAPSKSPGDEPEVLGAEVTPESTGSSAGAVVAGVLFANIKPPAASTERHTEAPMAELIMVVV
jgi:uncharacterized cupin superfamily protein